MARNLLLTSCVACSRCKTNKMGSIGTGDSWLVQAKDDIAMTVEWKELTSELFDAVQQQLSENHVKHFSDLTDSEKNVFIERAAKLVKGNSAHTRLVSKVSELLDKHLNETVSDELLNPLNAGTKTDLVLGRACSAAVELLRRWPDMTNKLLTCLNRPLRGDIRRAVWSLILVNPKIGDSFLQRFDLDKNDTQALQDATIVQKCQAFLSSESSFQEISSNPAILFAMKTVLSYRQVYLKTTSTVVDTEYLLLVPFVKVFVDADSNSPGEVERDHFARILETYFTFMESRPMFLKDTGTKEYLAALKHFGVEMAKSLESKDYQLASHLRKIYSSEKSSSLSDGLAALMRSQIRCLFVGFLALDVVCFIWDQYILSLKAENFRVVPAFCVVLMVLLKEKLLKCRNVRNIEDVLLEDSKNFTVRNFQTEIEDKFMAEWTSAVNSDLQGHELPLVDPLASMDDRHPWSAWFADQRPSRTKPGDRRAARQDRENERRRQLEKKLREERDRGKEQELTQREKVEQLKEKHKEQQKQERDKVRLLKEQLEAERCAHQQTEAQMAAEITRLKMELGRKQMTPSAGSYALAPSPSVVGSTPEGSPRVRQPSAQSQTPEDEANDVARLLIGQVMGNIDLLIHGRGDDRRELDMFTRAALERQSDEYREVMIELFGRELTKEDWDHMGEDERGRKTDLLLHRLKERLQEHDHGTQH